MSSSQKRLVTELKAFREKPVANCGVEPTEANFNLWDCVIEVHVTKRTAFGPKDVSFPLHFLVEFPPGYPAKAPSVGFSTTFPYSDGASYTIRDEEKLLNGKYVICLDLLGNFANVHDEWKATKGSGWSPAYDISALLVVLQSVIIENISKASAAEIDAIAKACLDYASKNNIPEIHHAAGSALEAESAVGGGGAVGSGRPLGGTLAIDFSTARSSVPDTIKEKCTALYAQLTSESQQNDLTSILNYFVHGEFVDSTIACWFTRETYLDQVLGFGIKIEAKGSAGAKQYNLTTDGNYISHSAFAGEAQLRTFPTKETFDAFLPAWINKTHSSRPDWIKVLKKSLLDIGKTMGCKNESDAIQKIYPEIINNMVVKMMDASSDFRASESIFQCIVNLWRTFFYLTNAIPGLKDEIISKLRRFITVESSRLKSETPNIGHTLLTSIVLRESELNWGEFFDAFDQESSLRRVFWWQKNGIQITAETTYRESHIGRKNIVFQTMFKRVILGMANIDETVAAIDLSHCKLPDRLGLFLTEWKDAEARMERETTWTLYYQILGKNGLSDARRDSFLADITGSIHRTYDKAQEIEGYHYTPGGRGGGRGFEAGRGGGRGGRFGGGFGGGAQDQWARGGRGFAQGPAAQVCQNFQRFRNCRFGDNCRNLHL